MPYIGVPRDIVATHMQRGPQRRGHPRPYVDFYQYQAHAPALVDGGGVSGEGGVTWCGVCRSALRCDEEPVSVEG